MTFEPNALITSTSLRRSASNRCQLSLTRSSWRYISRLFKSANRAGNGGLSTPDREGKTLDMSPTALLGCAVVEVVPHRFGLLGKEMPGALARVHSRSFCTLSIIVMLCSGVRSGVVYERKWLSCGETTG